MPDFHLPLSGDVTQSINPWNWLFHGSYNQIGLINVRLGNSGDPEIEKKILDDVGTYGRQLGRIGDALGVLIDHMDQSSLSVKEQHAIRALRLQLEQIELIKEEKQSAGNAA
jgi:hypothetical protein